MRVFYVRLKTGVEMMATHMQPVKLLEGGDVISAWEITDLSGARTRVYNTNITEVLA